MLAMRYNDMKSYKESDIRTEYDFILSQVEDLKHKKLLSCGFIKELRSWKRAENRKAKKLVGKKSPTKKKTLAPKKEDEKKYEGAALAPAGDSAPNADSGRNSIGLPGNAPELAVMADVNTHWSPSSASLGNHKKAGDSIGPIKTASVIGGSPGVTIDRKHVNDTKDADKVSMPPDSAKGTGASVIGNGIGIKGKSLVNIAPRVIPNEGTANGVASSITREMAIHGASASASGASSKENTGLTEQQGEQTIGLKGVDSSAKKNFEEAPAIMSSTVANGKGGMKKQLGEAEEGKASHGLGGDVKKNGIATERCIVPSSGENSGDALKNSNGGVSEKQITRLDVVGKERTVAPNGTLKRKSGSSSPGEVSNVDEATTSKKGNGSGRDAVLELRNGILALDSSLSAEVQEKKTAENGISVDRTSAPNVAEAAETRIGDPKADVPDAKLGNAIVHPSSSS